MRYGYRSCGGYHRSFNQVLRRLTNFNVQLSTEGGGAPLQGILNPSPCGVTTLAREGTVSYIPSPQIVVIGRPRKWRQ